MRTSLIRLALMFLASIIPLASGSIFGQLTEIENKLPKIVPLEVEFKNYDKENWWHDLEIKVTNTGKRPIYYLSLYLWLDANYPQNVGPGSGKQMAIYFEFGDIKRFFSTSNGEMARPDDPAILAGESYTFTVGDNYIKGWDLLKKSGSFAEPVKGKLEHGFTNFGNGTGLEPGGTLWRIPKRNLP
jgi:hypothetical protein